MLLFYFLRRLLFLRVGASEKVDDVLSGGSIGAILVVVRTLTFPVGVRLVLVRIRNGVPPG